MNYLLNFHAFVVGVSVESALLVLRNWICKVFDDGTILPAEPSKKQRLILEAINDTVGKF